MVSVEGPGGVLAGLTAAVRLVESSVDVMGDLPVEQRGAVVVALEDLARLVDRACDVIELRM